MKIKTLYLLSPKIKWLSKSKTVKIDGQELTVLPYGYLGQAVKSSLQEQRQSILEEIEKKIKELGIQTDKADTQIQNEDFNEFFSKEDAEKLIHDNLIIIKALEDIKQLLKIN